jgi:siroheme synthase
VVTCLREAAAVAGAARIAAPTIVVIGEVVRLHSALAWFAADAGGE